MTHIEWQFGGWLRGWSAPAATGLLLTLGVAGLFAVAWSYRRTTREIPARSRRLLAGLRLAVVLLLLLCLANPVRVEEVAPPKPSSRTLTVLVDRSASMTQPDARGGTRLASAVRLWRQVEPTANLNFKNVRYFRFADDLAPAASFDDAVKGGAPGGETHLFDALRKALDENPAAIVCLTDGLDTSKDDASKFATEAAGRDVPIYFVPGENHLLPGASLTLRETVAPAHVLRQSQFKATAVIETMMAQDRELPAELSVNGQKFASARLPVRAGRNTISWPVTVDSGEPGRLTLEFTVGDQSASCAVDVVENTSMDVLYYQGALQWGYRFLRGALESDPSFRLTAILNPALQVQLTSTPANGSALNDLPEDAAELRRFQIVILAHAFADQLTPKQQQALENYVRGGGGVLFISPDAEATEHFSGTTLEQMLPVVFARHNDPGNAALEQMRLQLSANAAQAGSDALAGGSQAILLKTFALPAGSHGAVSALFAGTNGEHLPKFAENAKVRAVKPGAETLAISRQDPPDVLLARQQYGNGFAAALNTDLLWRWKMSLPSGSHSVEKFWQQLLLSLSPGSGQGLRLVKLTAFPSVHAPAVFSVSAPGSENAPNVEALSPDGKSQRLALTESTDASGQGWRASFAPPTSGRWEVRATDASGRLVRVTFPVAEKVGSMELLNLPADTAGMSQLATSTGGSLVENAAAFQSTDEPAAKPPAKPPQPLWNSSVLLLVLIGCYATELVVRRRCKLL